MPAPLVPLALGAGLALWTLYEQHSRQGARDATLPPASPALPPVPLLPGAEPFLPPIAAPEQIRNLVANALFSQNPVTLRTVAKNLQALGYGDVATPLLARAATLDHGPAVAGDWLGDHRSDWREDLQDAAPHGHVGDDLEALARAAGVGAWSHHARGHRDAAWLGWARRKTGVGAGPPIYVGERPHLYRRRPGKHFRRTF